MKSYHVSSPVWVQVHAPHLQPKPRAEKTKPRVERAPAAVQKQEWGPRLWQELHLRAISKSADDTVWLEEFRKKIQCGPCRKHWVDMLERTPPEWSNYFAWTVDRHNETNAKLGKPVMSHDDARNRWLRTDL